MDAATPQCLTAPSMSSTGSSLFPLALGSGCLIGCKHLNDLSYSVDFLSIIPAKLFALLPGWQAFQVI